jgi:hypothetical protein
MDVKKDQKVVVLATGGTIAGVAEDVSKPNNYVSGQLGVNQFGHFRLKCLFVKFASLCPFDVRHKGDAVLSGPKVAVRAVLEIDVGEVTHADTP